MKISIALATYNGAGHLEEQLQSLASQTLLPHELVVSDDGSTDGTLEILRRFAAEAPFSVKVHINPQRMGYTDNFIQATLLCEGDWIALCDQDDVWLKSKLHEISSVASGDTALIVHPVQPVDAELRAIEAQSVTTRVKFGKGPFRLATFGYFSGLGVVFRRDLVNFITHRPRFPDRHDMSKEAAHDEWICALADALGSTKKIDKELVLYRQHENNTCGAWTKKPANLYPIAEYSSHERYVELALAYATCFDGIASAFPLDARQKKTVKLASKHYQRAHKYFALRAHLYRNTSAAGRLVDWTKLATQWLYRFNPGAAPVLACVKDLVAILMTSSVVVQPKRDSGI